MKIWRVTVDAYHQWPETKLLWIWIGICVTVGVIVKVLS